MVLQRKLQKLLRVKLNWQRAGDRIIIGGLLMERKSDFRRRLEEDLKDPEFKKEWDSLELEFQIQAALMQARVDADMTQAELAKKSGIRQSNISRIESGAVLPRLDTLETLARAMGKQLKITMV